MKKEALTLLLALALFFVAAPKAEAATGGHTQSEAVAWTMGQIGVAEDYDGVAGVQCVDLIKAYYNYLGQGNPSGNAYDYMDNWIPDGWTRLTNEQTSPQPGDVMVNGKFAYGALEFGHVGIIVEVTSQGYKYVDFNGTGNHDPGTLRPTDDYKPLNAFSCVIRPDWPGGTTTPPAGGRFAWDEATHTLTIRNVGEPANVASLEGWDGNKYYLEHIVIEDGFTSIGSEAFKGCGDLISISIPDVVTSIGDRAFKGCNSLKSISIPDGVASIPVEAFESCYRLTSISIPDSVNFIGGSAFAGCHNLTSISIPDSVTFIGGSAFAYCSNLTSVSISNSVTSIGANTFENCTSLTSISIPDSVTSIGDCAFVQCSSLTGISIPDSVTFIGGSAFAYCSNLTSVSISNSVTSIEPGTFNNCSSLTSVSIPNGVISIRQEAFGGCSSLTSISIPNGVIFIEQDTFRDCSGLTSISIPNSVTYIDYWAFIRCSNLISISIPNSVASIAPEAFEGCDSLRDVYYSGSISEWNKLKTRIYNEGNEPLLNASLHVVPTVPLIAPTTIKIENPEIPVSTTIWAVSQSSLNRLLNVFTSEVDAAGEAVFSSPLTPGSKIFFLEPGTFRPLAPAAILEIP